MRFPSAMAVALLIAAVTSPIAGAESHSGTPSVWTILAKSNAAVVKQKTVAIVGTSTANVVTHRPNNVTVSWVDTGKFSGMGSTDTSGRSEFTESLSTVSDGVTKSLTFEYDTVHNEIASHVSGGKGWKCGNAGVVLNSIDVWTPVQIGVITKAVAVKSKAKVVLAGSTTYHGSTVWTVRVSSHAWSAKTKITSVDTGTYYVDRSTYLLDGQAGTESEKGPTGIVRLNNAATFSNYGSALNPQMHGCPTK